MPVFGPSLEQLAAGLAGWFWCAACLAAPPAIQSPDEILYCAERHLQAAAASQHSGRIEVKLGHLDRRLRLSRCEQPLEAFHPAGAHLNGATSVGVRCPSTSGWTIYVPASIDIFRDAVVTTRTLAKGSPVKPTDVRLTETKISKLDRGHMQSLDDIEGMVVRRPVPAGTVLTPDLLTSPRLIRRGARVMLVNDLGAIKVEMLGEAVSDAARGERVRVRALNSGEIVEGWVESASVVKVTL